VTTDELAGEHFPAENYEVGLIVTTCSRATVSVASEAVQQQLHLRFWLILTNQRELFPRLSLDSKHRLIARLMPQSRSLTDGTYARVCVLLRCLQCHSRVSLVIVMNDPASLPHPGNSLQDVVLVNRVYSFVCL